MCLWYPLALGLNGNQAWASQLFLPPGSVPSQPRTALHPSQAPGCSSGGGGAGAALFLAGGRAQGGERQLAPACEAEPGVPLPERGPHGPFAAGGQNSTPCLPLGRQSLSPEAPRGWALGPWGVSP